MKYRIKKTCEKTISEKIITTYYNIQYKKFGLWFTVKLPCTYFNIHDGLLMAYFEKRDFFNEDYVIEYVNELSTLPKNIYRVIDETGIRLEPYYINKKYKYKDYNEYCQLVDYYEYGNSVKELNDKTHIILKITYYEIN